MVEDGGRRMESDQPWGLLLSDDLIFSSRITGTAQTLKLKVISVKSTDQLITHSQDLSPTCIIIDLSHPGLRIPELIRQLRVTCSPMPRLVAYGSHVDATGLRAAREAGCDVVLPRSSFVEILKKILVNG